MNSPAPVYVLTVVRAVIVGDWMLARWAAREAVLARVSTLWDEGHDVVIPMREPAVGRPPLNGANAHRVAAARARARCVDLEQAVKWCRGRIAELERDGPWSLR